MGTLTGQMIVMDIDGTQLPEGPTKDQDMIDQAGDIAALKSFLEQAAAEGAIIVHSTNRMAHLFEEDHVTGILAMPHYATTTASTEIWKCDRETGDLIPDPRFQDKLDAIDYNETEIRAQIQELVDAGKMVWSSEKDQTTIKASALFVDDISAEERMQIHAELQAKQAEGVTAFLVHGGDEWIIDVMPEICTKDNVIATISEEHGIPSERIFVAGNSNNDASMFVPGRPGVAVASAKDSLKEHVRGLETAFDDAVYAKNVGPQIAPAGLSPAASVLWGLQQTFGTQLDSRETAPAASA